MGRSLATRAGVAAIVAALGSGVAQADACLEEIRAVWADHLDPFKRPAHRQELTVLGPDGAVVRVLDSWIETPLISMSGVRGMGLYALVRDRESWTGPSPEGPWTQAPNLLPADREATSRRLHAEQGANMADAACPGEVERDGLRYLAYTFTTQTDPDPAMDGNWFGATTTVYLGTETFLPEVFEQTDMVSAWRPEPNGERNVIHVTYEPDMSLPDPE